MLVESAFVGALGFDTDTKLSLDHASRLAARGFKFAVRYLSLGAANPYADLDVKETRAILAGGLALMVVQHVRLPGWVPSAIMGASDGSHAVSNAIEAGIPKGVSLYCDLEGVNGSAAETIAYANAVAHAVRAGGFEPAVYVGAQVPLSADELYHALSTECYWRSFSQVPEVRSRGYSMIQLYDTQMIEGVSIDIDVVQKDYLGGMPHWVRGTPSGLVALDALSNGDTDPGDSSPTTPT